MEKKIKVGIIGYGRFGSMLAEYLIEMKMLSFIVVNKSLQEEKLLDLKNNFFDIPTHNNFQFLTNSNQMPNFIFICVPDSSIKLISTELAKTLGKNTNNLQTIFVHCSGVLELKELNSLRKNGWNTASLHPFQTFSGISYNPVNIMFKDLPWKISLSNKKIQIPISDLIMEMKGIEFSLAQEDEYLNAIYHISAIAASNYIISSMHFSTKLLQHLKLPSELIFQKILVQTLSNGISDAIDGSYSLTGPIARADIKTIKLHLNTLKPYKFQLKEYIYFSLATLETAKETRTINEGNYIKIRDLLLKNLTL